MQMMAAGQIIIVLLGALAGGFVSGLSGFGTGITAMGLWLYAISPPVAASLVIICSIISQLQTLPMVWHAIQWRGVLPYVVPGLIGVPVGTLLLSRIEPNLFKIGVGLFLVAYSIYAFSRRNEIRSAVGGWVADGAAGFGGGVLGGLAGFAGPPLIVWTDIRGYKKEYRRSVLQAFSISILLAAFLSHALSGLLTKQVGLATIAALPGTISGAWCGAFVYRRLGNRGFQQVIMALLLLSGVILIWTSL
jgi:uncharacterized membrane protein YfcA